jgi:hypothetical protein
MPYGAMRYRAVLIDLAIGVGIPILVMILRTFTNDIHTLSFTHLHHQTELIVQGHRFNIYEQIGCFPMTYNTKAAYPLVFAWPTIIGSISAVYCGKHRITLVTLSNTQLLRSFDHSRLRKETFQIYPNPCQLL